MCNIDPWTLPEFALFEVTEDGEDARREAEQEAPRWGPCCLCHATEVCYSEGFDTCSQCLAKQ